jgi:hypothetical protein
MPNERAKRIPADGTQSAGVPCWQYVEEFHRELPALSYLNRSYPRLEQQLERGIAQDFAEVLKLGEPNPFVTG